MKKIIHEEICTILSTPFSADYEKAYKDLIYAIEHCVESQLIPYCYGVDIFKKIEEDRVSGNKSLYRLNEIRNELKAGIQL